MEKILLIEPDQSLSDQLLDQLKGAGYVDVLQCFSGEEALTQCKLQKPDLLIVDSDLPDFFGLELPEKIAEESDQYGTPKLILLWPAFLPLEETNELKERLHLVGTIKKPYEADQILPPVKKAFEVVKEATDDADQFDVLPAEYIQIFVDSAMNFFESMTDIEPKVGQFYFKKDPFAQADVSSKMDVTGNLSGTVCLSFESKIAAHIVSSMLGEYIATINKDVIDGVGELVNIITGNAKAFFSDKGYPFKIGLPKVFTGKQFTHRLAPKTPCVVIPFFSDKGSFYIEICVILSKT